jgi:hypothetical protein
MTCVVHGSDVSSKNYLSVWNLQVLDQSQNWSAEQRQRVAAQLLHQPFTPGPMPIATTGGATMLDEDQYSPRQAMPVATWSRSGVARRSVADEYAATASMVDPPIGPLNTIHGNPLVRARVVSTSDAACTAFFTCRVLI